MSVYDIAGQHMYHKMSRLFVTPELSIYVGTLNLSLEPEDLLFDEDAERPLNQIEDLQGWLTTIHSLAPEAPILIVGTHSQSQERDDQNLKQFMTNCGLEAWHPYIVKHTTLHTPQQLRQITAADLKKLAKAANWRIDQKTIDQVATPPYLRIRLGCF